MASDRARQVARDVIKNLRNPTVTEKYKKDILKKYKYAESVQDHPDIVTKTKSYQEEVRPILKRLEGLRDKVIVEMESKDITKEQFSELAGVLRGLNHDIQLIGGNPTERTLLIEVPPEIAEKNEITPRSK